MSTIAITGASGFIGSALARALRVDGHDVRPFVRRRPAAAASAGAAGEVAWDPARGTIDVAALEGVDAVVHLAGEPLAQRWTPRVKHRLRASRVNSTRLLVRALASLAPRPRVLVSGSAIGIYGDRGDELLDETSAVGAGFLADICREWEAAAAGAAAAGIRVTTLRTGLVFAPGGGALQKMLIPFRWGVGGRLGSGRQWVSWISRRDAVRAIRFVLATDALAGPVNLTAPTPVTNAELTEALARAAGRRTLFPVPRAAVSLLFGQMGRETVLASQRVLPRRLVHAGFQFETERVDGALEDPPLHATR